MSLVFTMPGKLGDAILQWPVAYHYCKQHETKCTLWLDKHTLEPLVNLFRAQPVVESVVLRGGIENWNMGGQPWDFGLETKDHLDHEIYHLGFRKFPQRQITLETLEQVPVHIVANKVAQEPSLFVGPIEQKNRLVLHGTFASHMTGSPGFWRFLFDRWAELRTLFEEVTFVGKPDEVQRALEIYPEASGFDDGGDFLVLAKHIAGSRLVIGSGSSVVTVGGALKVPTIRVHDPIGEFPRVIWSNLGDGQLNESERDLRKLWPQFRDRWIREPIAMGGATDGSGQGT